MAKSWRRSKIGRVVAEVEDWPSRGGGQGLAESVGIAGGGKICSMEEWSRGSRRCGDYMVGGDLGSLVRSRDGRSEWRGVGRRCSGGVPLVKGSNRGPSSELTGECCLDAAAHKH